MSETTYNPSFDSSEYTFNVDFSEFIPVFNGLIDVWIGDGTLPAGQSYEDGSGLIKYKGGTAGYLYGKYHNGAIDEIGFVSDYEAAKSYFAEHGLEMNLTYDQWIGIISSMSTYAGQAIEQANRSAMWAAGTDTGNGSATNNSKYWAEQSKGYTNGKDLNGQNVQARATDNAEYFKDLAKDWATKSTDVESGLKSAKTYAESAHEDSLKSESYARGTRGGATDSATEFDNALYYSNQAKGWATGVGSHTNESAKEYALQSEAWAKGTRGGATDSARQDDNAKKYSEVASAAAITAQAWAETGTNLPTGSKSSKAWALEAAGSASSASGSASSASGSASSAADSASAASGYAQNASDSASQAAGSAQTALTSESHTSTMSGEAAASANAASQSAENASASATYAAGQASDAHTYAETAREKAAAANTSATNASTSETNAATSASNALASEQNAFSSEVNAAASATAASTSAGNALTSERTAAQWATGSTTGTPSSTNNALYYAGLAQTRADSVRGATVGIQYANSIDGTTPPDSGWDSDPNPVAGNYMWTKMIMTWTDNSSSVVYSVSHIGADGTGAVNSVNTQTGAVVLYGTNIKLENESSPTVASSISNIYTALNSKVSSSFGTSFSGKVLGINSSGNVAPVDVSVNCTYDSNNNKLTVTL